MKLDLNDETALAGAAPNTITDKGTIMLTETIAQEKKTTPLILQEAPTEIDASRERAFNKLIESLPIPGIQLEKGQRAIEVKPGNLSEVVSEAESVLIQGKAGIYQRSGRLVRIVTEATKPKPSVRAVPSTNNTNDCAKKKITRAEDALVIHEVDPTHLTEVLSINAVWVRFDERTQKHKQKDCPERVAKTLISRRSWELPVLTGIIQAPTLRPDGSILETPGYDEETGLFFDPGQTKFPKIPDRPTKEDAENSLQLLLDLIAEFPFENEESRSVALSAFLTAVIRKSIRTAPLHGFSAPKMSSGKSLLADMVGMIATGKVNCAIPHAENEAEEKKRLLAVLSEGDPVVCFDNVERPLGSAALCSVLTQTEYKDRLLGSTKNLSVLTNATFLATGNNLRFEGDLSTRAILCKLDPLCERPEERKFSKNLYEYVPQHRGALVIAAITILRAYHFADRPKQDIPAYGRFEEWSDFVRSALVWVGCEDPCKSRKEIESADPVRIALGSLFPLWHKIYGSRGMRIKDVIQDCENKKNEDPDFEALAEALSELSSDGKSGNTRSLGKKFSSFKGRIENGFCLESAGTYQGVETWRVVKR